MSDNLKEVTAKYMANVCYHNTQGSPSKLRFYFRNRPPSVFINNVHIRGTLMQDGSGTYLQIICQPGAHWRYTIDNGSDVCAIRQEVHRTQSQSGDNLKVAKECGAVELGDQSYFDGGKWIEYPRLVLTGKALEAYTSRILASQQAAHDAEIAKWKLAAAKWQELQQEYQLSLDLSDAACAMNAEKLAHLEYYIGNPSAWDSYSENVSEAIRQVADEIKSATSQQVSEWEAKKLEPLRSQVAMLSRFIEDHESADNSGGEYPSECIACGERYGKHIKDCELVAVTENTQSTAEQFIAECEQRGAVKVLEEVISAHDSLRLDDDMLWLANSIRAMADARRATSKKAG